MTYEKGTVLLLSDGRLLRLLEVGTDKELDEVQFVDREEPSFLRSKELDLEDNLGRSPSVLCQFYAAWNIYKKTKLDNKKTIFPGGGTLN